MIVALPSVVVGEMFELRKLVTLNAEAEIPTHREISRVRKNGRIEDNVKKTISNQSLRGKRENGCAGVIFFVCRNTPQRKERRSFCRRIRM